MRLRVDAFSLKKVGHRKTIGQTWNRQVVVDLAASTEAVRALRRAQPHGISFSLMVTS
jgi:hypothetical protein